VLGIDFMGLFPPSHNNLYFFMVVYYVCKWVEVIATATIDSKFMIKFLKKNIFTRFGSRRALFSDNMTHFYNKPLESILKKYWGFHKVAKPYHP